MPSAQSIKVIHPNGTTYTQRARGVDLVSRGKAYWRDPTKTVLVIIPANDDTADPKKEYMGRHSRDRFAVRKIIERRSGTLIEIPVEQLDRTQIPVRLAGGQKVMQLADKSDRRSSGRATKFHDLLWRPAH